MERKQIVASAIWSNLKEGVEFYAAAEGKRVSANPRAGTRGLFERAKPQERTLRFGLALCRSVSFCEEYFQTPVAMDWLPGHEFETFGDLKSVVDYLTAKVVKEDALEFIYV